MNTLIAKRNFQIQYIIRYYEQKEYCSEIIKANSEEEALKKFAKMFDIKDHTLLNEPNFMWEDGEWLASFKCINEIEEVTCLLCQGSGKIHLNIEK